MTKISRSLGIIFTVDRRSLSSTYSFRLNPWIYYCEIWPRETRDITLWYGVKHVSIFWTHWQWHVLNRVGVTQECNRRSDGRTDFIVANAAAFATVDLRGRIFTKFGSAGCLANKTTCDYFLAIGVNVWILCGVVYLAACDTHLNLRLCCWFS